MGRVGGVSKGGRKNLLWPESDFGKMNAELEIAMMSAIERMQRKRFEIQICSQKNRVEGLWRHRETLERRPLLSSWKLSFVGSNLSS